MKFASQGQVVEAEQVQEEGETFLQELVGAQNQHQRPMSQRRFNMIKGRAQKPGLALANEKAHLRREKTLLRYALKKKNDIIWEFFPTWGGGSSQIPKLL